MDLFSYVAAGFKALFLDQSAMSELGQDAHAWRNAYSAIAILFAFQFLIVLVVGAFMIGVNNFAPSADLQVWSGMPLLLIFFLAFVFLSFVMPLIAYGILHLLALLFGGSAKFPQFFGSAVALSTASTIVSSGVGMASLVPFIGLLLSLGWNVYLFVVWVNLLKVIHGISMGRAVGVLLIPVVVVIFLALLVAYFLVLGPSGYVFSDFIPSVG